MVLIPLAVLAGSFAAPMLTLRSRVAELTMPDGTGTETFTWLLLAVMVGASASSALAGPLVEAGGWRAGVVLGGRRAAARAPPALRRPTPPARGRTATRIVKSKGMKPMDKTTPGAAGPTARIPAHA